MKNLLALLCAITLCAQPAAARRSQSEMRQLAARQLARINSRHSTTAEASEAAVKSYADGRQSIDELIAMDHLAVYGNDEGYVVVNAENVMSPILGYSTRSLKADRLPCGMQWWLRGIDDAIHVRLMSPGVMAEAEHRTFTPVDNFLKAKWGQEDPYNALCPKVNGTLPPCGCLATAMAQVLYYYRYPQQGKGKGWYTLGQSASHINANISSTYDWDHIYDTYKGAIDDAKRIPVATLLRDCGYGVNMAYDVSGSGAYSSSCAASLIDNFSYAPQSLRYYNRQFFSSDEWMDMIQQELLAGRPVLYGGSDSSYGGHAFIFSGINADGLVYVNWGWNGDSDGYYDIRSLNPTGILGISSVFAFTEGQSMIIGIKPTADATDTAVDNYLAIDEVFRVKKFGSTSLQLVGGRVYNLGYRDFTGEIGFLFLSDDGDDAKTTYYKAYDNTTGEAIRVGYPTEITSKLQNIKALPAGSYHIYMVAQNVEAERRELMRGPGGICRYAFTKDADGSITLGESEILDAIRDIRFDDNVHGHSGSDSSHRTGSGSSAADDAVTRVYDTSGNLVYSSPTPQFNLWDVPARGILMIKQGNHIRKVVR